MSPGAPLSALEREVLAALEHRPISLDSVLARTGGELMAVTVALQGLAERGRARSAGAGWELT